MFLRRGKFSHNFFGLTICGVDEGSDGGGREVGGVAMVRCLMMVMMVWWWH